MNKWIGALILFSQIGLPASETKNFDDWVAAENKVPVLVIGVTSLVSDPVERFDALKAFRPSAVAYLVPNYDRKVSQVADRIAKASGLGKSMTWRNRSELPEGRVILIVAAAKLSEVRDWVNENPRYGLEEVGDWLPKTRNKLGATLPTSPIALMKPLLVG